ncbi:sodium:solute symporter family protein [Rhodococcus sp. P1Y]|uniref:sodium:solute symporter family protein n=1 Tax=Rhodococcus sp. P1Y TaxID=1302308 RepID=UPI000EB20490|nr:sodium:solute symporter family protein [Rhodococcus sp. P1Y]AYJ48250.1 sodium:solute symporter family protein [Rhodococcus sp. P1Y]
MIITFGALSVFFLLIVGVLHVSKTRRSVATFSNYAVGERSFSSWFVSMAYTNSWWPGSTFTAVFGLTVASGVIGLYFLVYSVLGVLAMYFIARPVWKWGKKFDLRTQADLLDLRYDSRALKLIGSAISVVALVPWLVLGLIAMGAVIQWASLGKLSDADSILIGIAVLVVRQFWTVQMGMRGLIVTDMVQGVVAYIGSAVLCLGLLFFYFGGVSNIGQLTDSQLSLPGFGSAEGGLYYFGIVAAGIIGSLCWPMIFTRIYTAASVREVKKGSLQTMAIGFVFCVLLMLVALCAAPLSFAAANPVSSFFALSQNAGGTWLLAAALVIVFAAGMGFVDGVTQAIGTQVANDIVAVVHPLRDKQELYLAKAAMAVTAVIAAVIAYRIYDSPNLAGVTQLAYQAIIQLAVPIFGGLVWRRGNRDGAIAGLLVGAAIALALTVPYMDNGGAVPWLEGLGSGLVGLVVNLLVFVIVSLVRPSDRTELDRVDQLFRSAREQAPDPVPAVRAPSL